MNNKHSFAHHVLYLNYSINSNKQEINFTRIYDKAMLEVINDTHVTPAPLGLN